MIPGSVPDLFFTVWLWIRLNNADPDYCFQVKLFLGNGVVMKKVILNIFTRRNTLSHKEGMLQYSATLVSILLRMNLTVVRNFYFSCKERGKKMVQS